MPAERGVEQGSREGPAGEAVAARDRVEQRDALEGGREASGEREALAAKGAVICDLDDPLACRVVDAGCVDLTDDDAQTSALLGAGEASSEARWDAAAAILASQSRRASRQGKVGEAPRPSRTGPARRGVELGDRW